MACTGCEMGWSFGKILILSFEDGEEHIFNRLLSYANEEIEVLKHDDFCKEKLHFEGLCIDKYKRIVVRDENEIELTYTEFEILLLLAQNAGIVFSNIYMAKVMTLFVYIKLFESIVTVEGEDFLNSREEKECYKLVRESTKFIYDRLEEFSKYNCKTASDELNRHMRNMFKNMRSSLKEEVGSIKKDFL